MTPPKRNRAERAPRMALGHGACILEIVAKELREGNCCVPVGAWTEYGIQQIELSARFLRGKLPPHPAKNLAKLREAVTDSAMRLHDYIESPKSKFGKYERLRVAHRKTCARLELALRRERGKAR